MLPEIRTLTERAAAQRALLDDLLDAVPAGYWARRAPGEGWNAQQNLQHLATIEALLRDDIVRVRDSDGQAWLGGAPDPARLMALREAALASMAGEGVPALRGRMAANRAALVALLNDLAVDELDAGVLFPGVTDAWGTPLRWDLRHYLAAWPVHDAEHAATIRAALAAPPDLSTIAITRRLN
jgi:hypothetical protein